MTEKPLTAKDLADALECFWNAAMSAHHNGNSTTGNIVEGIAAVSIRLHEIADAVPTTETIEALESDNKRLREELEYYKQAPPYDTIGMVRGRMRKDEAMKGGAA